MTPLESSDDGKVIYGNFSPPGMGSKNRSTNDFVDTGGGPPYDGGMEARIAKLEASTNYIERDIKELKDDVRTIRNEIASIRNTDFRIIFGAIIFVALGLAGIMAKGFGWI